MIHFFSYRWFIRFFLFIAILALSGSQAYADFRLPAVDWPTDASMMIELANREVSGSALGSEISCRIQLLWNDNAKLDYPQLHVRLIGDVTSIGGEYLFGRLGFVTGLFMVGLPDGVSIDQNESLIQCFNGNSWTPLRNRTLNSTEETAIAESLGSDFLSSSGAADFDAITITSAYTRYLSQDVFIVEPTNQFYQVPSGDVKKTTDFYWLEPSDENDNPLINYINPSASIVDELPIEIVIPFTDISGGEITFYFGYLEVVSMESVRRHSNRAVFNYRVWEDHITFPGYESENNSDTSIIASEENPSLVIPDENDEESSLEGRLRAVLELFNSSEKIDEADLQAESAFLEKIEGMIYIPPGRYIIGSDTTDQMAVNIERPSHYVNLDGFLIDEFPVTNAEFWNFIGDSGYEPQGEWMYYYNPGTEDHPVRGINLFDASAYAEWAGKRLPTEEEWEAAARGLEGNIYPWGNEWNASYVAIHEVTNIYAHPENISPFGVREMSGNVWEWTSSPYLPYQGTEGGIPHFVVLKGGAINCGAGLCRNAMRGADWPNAPISTYGFRCALDIPGPDGLVTLIDSGDSGSLSFLVDEEDGDDGDESDRSTDKDTPN